MRKLLILVLVCLISVNCIQVNANRDNFTDTYVATDELGRKLPTNKETGDVKKDKYVGIFYFLFMDAANTRLLDHSRIYANYGTEAVWDVLVQNGMHLWGEPYFGYYKNTDEWIYRKHAQMLSLAGVDFVFLDTTNQGGLFPHAWKTMFEVWNDIREKGGTTPQIAFHCGDNADTMELHVDQFWKEIYKDGKYKDLWFMWEGKPLILGNPDFLKDSFKEFFTIRRSWAFNSWTDDGTERWPWIAEYPQLPGRNIDGVVEQVVVSAGFHSNSSRGRSFSNNNMNETNRMDFGFSLESTGKGLAFEETWKQALKIDPPVVMITGWNEFTMGRWENAGVGQRISGTFTIKENDLQFMNNYVDCFNVEYSRDIEPMSGFHGDNYLYQMASNIRKFKGVRQIPKVTGCRVIDDLSDLSVWDNINPSFYDITDDIAHRDHQSVGGVYHYVNTTGRNDIDYVKVSKASGKTYFMINCVNDIITDSGSNWMNVFVDSDMDYNTGWKGYDYIINRTRDGSTVSVEKFLNNSWRIVSVGKADFVLKDKTLVISVNDSLIGLDGIDSFDFKCADNSTIDGNVMEFMDLGDAAPNDRYNFRFIKEGGRVKGNLNIPRNVILFSITSLVIILLVYALVVLSKKTNKQIFKRVAFFTLFLIFAVSFFTFYEPNEIVLLVKRDISDGADMELLNECIDKYIREFNKEYPQIPVKVKYVNDFPDKLKKNDVLLINADSALWYMASSKYDNTKDESKLEDLSKYYKKYGINKDDILNSALKLGRIEDRQYYIPVNYDRTVVFADKNVFNLANVQIPSYDWNYAQFKGIAEKLTFSDNNTKYTGVFLPYHQNNVWQLFVNGFNGSWYENDVVNLTSENSLEGINAMFSLLEQGYAKGLGFNYKGSDRSTSAMSIAFACQSDRNGHYLLSEDEYLTNPATNYGLIDSGNAVLLPVPEFPAGKVGTCNTDFILGFAVNKDSKKKDAAAAFSLFSLTEKGQEILNEYYGGIPVNKKTWDKEFWKRGVLSGENANAVLYGIENDVRDDFFDAFMYEKNPYYWNLRTRVFFTCYMFRDYEKAPKNKSGSYIKYLKNFEDDINTMMISID